MPIRFKQDGYVPGSNGIRFQPGGNIIRAYSSGPTDPADTIDTNVSLLLHMDGTNGSTLFKDNSYTRKSVTSFGNAQISTSASKFGGASGYFDGTGDYLRVPYTSDFDLSGGDFTIEAWVNFSVVGGHLVGKDTYGSNFDWSIGFGANNIVCYTNGTMSSLVVTVPAWSTGVWYHVALVRSSGTNTFYVDGTAYGSNTMSITNASQSYMTVGCLSWNNPGFFFNGYIDELRISKVARYTSNFTPSTTRFANANTSLVPTSGIVTSGLVINLDAGDSASYPGTGTTWTDLNSTAIQFTSFGSPTYTASSPGYFSFNGAGTQYMTAPENSALNNANVTVEAWVKTNSTSQNGFFFEKGQVNTQYSLFLENGNIRWRTAGSSTYYDTSVTASLYITTSAWAQIVGTYSGGTKTLYVNGVSVATSTGIPAISTNTNGMSIGVLGGFSGTRGYYYNGSLSIINVYSKALSAAEVLQNYDAMKTRHGL